MNRTDPPAVYKTPAGYRALMDWYEDQVDRFRGPVESRYVDTNAGRTHVLVAGPEEAPPMIVLHGMNMNAAAMKTAFDRLTPMRQVYALDIIGMPGKSAGTRPSRTGSEYPRWLEEVMTALEVPRAAFLGQSFGGWLILKLAVRAPERIQSAVLLDSGGLVPFTWKGQFKAGLAAVQYMLWSSDRNLERAVRPFCASGVTPPPRLARLFGLAYQHVRLDVDVNGLPIPDSDALGALDVPVFVSYGAQDIFFRAERAVKRAQALWGEQAQTEVVAGEGHLFSEDGEQSLYDRIATFLDVEAN